MLARFFFFFSSRRRHTRCSRDWSSDVCSSDLHCLAYEEVRDLRDRLVRENVYLQEEIRREHPFEELVGSSPSLGAALHKVDQVAPGNTSVLILGETGTGKELIARAIHNRSARRDRPLVQVNCSAISAGLVESES